MSDLTSLFTDTLAKFSFRTVLSAAATLLICLVAVHLLGKLLRRLLARTKLDERIQKYLLAGVKLVLYIVTVLIVAESLNIPMTSLVALLSVGSGCHPGGGGHPGQRSRRAGDPLRPPLLHRGLCGGQRRGRHGP